MWPRRDFVAYLPVPLRRAEERWLTVSDRLIGVITQALEAMPPDLPGHVRADRPPGPGAGIVTLPKPTWDDTADQESLGKWLGAHLRPVLVALGQDTEAAGILAKMLPEPWAYRADYMPDLSGLSPEDLAAYEQTKTLLASAPPGQTISMASWSDALWERYDQSQARQKTAHDDWNKAFFKQPAVWLWALWEFWEYVTNLAAIPGVSEWQGVAKLSEPEDQKSDINYFLIYMCASIGCRIAQKPGEAANYLRRSLEDLRNRLVGNQETGGRPNNKTAVPTIDGLSKEARAIAAMVKHPGWSDEKIAEMAGCHPKSLYRMELFMRAKAMRRGGKNELPRGSKSKEGDVEGWERDDESDEDDTPDE